MAGRIREEAIAAVREATDLVDLVGSYVQLRPAGGARMKGLCPFHEERSPSFSVDGAKGLCHCFGCGEGGDAISFLMRQERLSFTEAVERLATRAGIELTYEGRSSGERGRLGHKSRLTAANAAAVSFYHRVLLSSPDAAGAREYLARRGYDHTAAARFQLGWAPGDRWDALVVELRRQGFNDDELVEAGLARRGPRGLRDVFHARVLFPIMDLGGAPVAFGGRIVAPPVTALEAAHAAGAARDAGPKYLNTAETALWHKGRVLYGLHWARGAIVRDEFAVVVEGYTDVLSLHLAGIEQAVATCGTALRADHLRALARFAPRVVLAFDADRAGAKATERGLEELLTLPEATLSLQVAVLPAGHDPAELIAAHGGAFFMDIVKRAQPLVQFWLEARLAQMPLRTPEERVRAAQTLIPVLRALPDEQQRNEYARTVVQRLHLEEQAYFAVVRGDRPPAPASSPVARRSPEARVEIEALKIVLQHPEWIAQSAARWDATWFTTPTATAAWRVLQQAGGPGSAVAAILEAADGDEERRFLRGLAVEHLAAEETPRYADEVGRRLEELRVGREVEGAKAGLQRVNPAEQPDEYARTFERLITLEARRRALREPQLDVQAGAVGGRSS